jgi:hypothetical protein
MSKKLFSSFIFGIAVALVLVSGNFYDAKAACGINLGCFPCLSLPCIGCASADRDMDKADRMTFNRSSHSSGSVGYGRGNINDFSHDF